MKGISFHYLKNCEKFIDLFVRNYFHQRNLEFAWQALKRKQLSKDRLKMNLADLDHHKILVAPSVLAADFANLESEIKRVVQAGAELVHLDVMDGHFVPNITLGPPVVKSLRRTTDALFDAHLMISRPLKYVDAFVDAGADHITFHLESDDEPQEVIKSIRARGRSVGLSIKPNTPADVVLPFLDQVEMILVMTVEPGFGGQSFMTEMMPKVSVLRREINRRGLNVHIQVDGGIDAETVKVVAAAGANVMVAGTSVFKNPGGASQMIAALHGAQDDFDAIALKLL